MVYRMKDRIFKAVLIILGLTGLYGIAVLACGKYTATDETAVVEIRQDGKVLYVLTPEELQEERRFTIEYEGHYNVIETGGGEVRVVEADCPDQICVKMGELHRHQGSIICLPHRLELRRREANEADAVAR